MDWRLTKMVFDVSFRDSVIFNSSKPATVSRDDQAQRMSDDGVPVWNITGMVPGKFGMDWVYVDVPLASNPSETFQSGSLLEYDGLSANVYRNKSGQHIYFNAAGVKQAV